MRQTIFTPTYNRAHLLPRLYKSLINQTFKDFKWLIIDDGSIDDTEAVVTNFINDGILEIQYIKKRNEGVTKARNYAYRIADTPYVTPIDSDDELLPDAIETFEKNWEEIEKQNLANIAKISLFAIGDDGKYFGYGNFSLPESIKFWDATWHEMVLKNHNYLELASSIDVRKYLSCVNLDNYKWKNQNFISEGILWATLGRNYKTRLINKIGRIVHTDAQNSILRNTPINEKKLLNVLVNNVFFINENIQYFFWNPKYFIASYYHLVAASQRIKFPSKKIKKQLTNRKANFLYTFLFIPLIILSKVSKRI